MMEAPCEALLFKLYSYSCSYNYLYHYYALFGSHSLVITNTSLFVVQRHIFLFIFYLFKKGVFTGFFSLLSVPRYPCLLHPEPYIPRNN